MFGAGGALGGGIAAAFHAAGATVTGIDRASRRPRTAWTA